MRLLFLNARAFLALSQDRLYRADLAEAQALMGRYIDAQSPQAASAVALTKQLATTALSVELPTIGDSMAAVRSLRTAPR